MSGGGRTGNMDFLGSAEKLGASAVLHKPFTSDVLDHGDRQLFVAGPSLDARSQDSSLRRGMSAPRREQVMAAARAANVKSEFEIVRRERGEAVRRQAAMLAQPRQQGRLERVARPNGVDDLDRARC